MIAAIYARKSTEQHGHADVASVARQLATARAIAAARGWSVAEAYSDHGVSGAEFARRPGLMRLMASLKPHPPFDVLLIADRDRLGREQIETSYLLKTLLQAGVRVVECQGEGQEITLSSPTDKVLLAVTSFAAEVEREQARVRTRAALEHRARAGHSTGGRIFGYAPARTADGHAIRAIVEAEAAVVRRIFLLASDGYGVKRIAVMLNAEAAPAPRKAGRVVGWAPSTVRGVLHNELYRGVAVWSRTRTRDVWGQRRPSRRDEAEVVRVDVPELRIVEEAVWQRAHARRAAVRALYFARAGEHGRAGGRPPSGSASRYLLSGLGACACCQGSMFVRARGDRPPRWACMTRHLRGHAVCANGLEVRLDDTEAAVLEAVASQLLTVAVLETALYKALATLQDPQDDAHAGLRDELARLDGDVARLADAIARGGALESLLGVLQDREQRRAHLRAALAAHERQQAARRPVGDAVALLRAALADWRGLLRHETGPARAALQALLAGRLVFTPGPEGYTFSGEGTVAPIIAGVVPNGLGARTRTIPPALRRALQHRDRGCRFPGCGGRFSRDITSVTGRRVAPTTLSNLALLCRRHHRAVHEEGYQVAREPDGALKFWRPDGRLLPEVPPPAAVPSHPVDALRAQHEAQGLRLHAQTACAGWLGGRLDLGWAIGVLHPLAQQPSTAVLATEPRPIGEATSCAEDGVQIHPRRASLA